jgi:hypothetical protein
MTSEKEVMTSDQEVMTSDQEVKTSDQEVMTSDQEVMTSDHQEVIEPSGSPPYSMQFDNPAFRTDASDPISCGGKNSDDDMSTSTTTTTRCIREKAVWELNEKVNKGKKYSWDAIPMDNVRRFFSVYEHLTIEIIILTFIPF